MATKRMTHRKKTSFTLPLAVVAGFMPMGWQVWQHAKIGDYANIPLAISEGLTGYNYIDRSWSLGNLKSGLLPIGLGFAVHKYIGGTLGLNRMIARAGIPFIRI